METPIMITKKIPMTFNHKMQIPRSHHSHRPESSHQTSKPSDVHTKAAQNPSTDQLD